MKQCAICHKDSKKVFRVRDGFICSECRKYIPEKINLKNTYSESLRKLYEKRKDIADTFDATAYIGNLYLDNVHCMLCYSKDGHKGTPLSLGDVYTVTELKEISLHLANVKNIGRRTPRIICDVKLKIKTADIDAEYIVARKKRCKVQEIENGKINFSEPMDVAVIREMLRQMFEDTFMGLDRKLKDILKYKELAENLKDTRWAKGILFLADREYTAEEVKAQYRKLCKIFHPDMNPDLPDDYMQMLNKAYAILTK